MKNKHYPSRASGLLLVLPLALMLAPSGTYGQTPGAWTLNGNIPLARMDHGMVAIGDELLIFGGFNTNDVEVADAGYYAPASANWTTVTNLPAARANMGFALFSNTVFSVGGWLSPSRYTDVWAYDSLEGGTWASLPSLPSRRECAFCAVISNYVYAVGGDNNGRTTQVLRYDAISGTNWVPMAPLQEARTFHGVAAVGGKIYALGGTDYPDIPVPSLEIYDPSSDSWNYGPNMPVAKDNFATAVVGSEIYVIGGFVVGTPDTPTNSVDIYNVQTGMWSSGPPLPVPLCSARAAVVGSSILVVGGTLGGQFGATNTVYRLSFEPTVNLIKAVKPSFSNLTLTTNYQLQVSGDLNIWTNQGSPFTATNSTMVYPQYWDVDNWNQLYFRLQVGP